MNVLHLISNIHWIPVIVLTLLSFILGAVWHHSLLFGNIWAKENNPANIQKKINAPLIFGGTALLHFLAISGIGAVVSGSGAIQGLASGFFISIVWIFPCMGGTYLFANRSIKLLLIDAGMYIVLFSIAGLILGKW